MLIISHNADGLQPEEEGGGDDVGGVGFLLFGTGGAGGP